MEYNQTLLMCAYIRGYIKRLNINFNNEIINKNLFELKENEINLLISKAKELNLKLYYFKEKENLPRVNIVLGFLKSIYPSSLLDIGSGRGVFLFPLLNEFPYMNITSYDILPNRVGLMNDIISGGVYNLKSFNQDITTITNFEKKYDVVTMLEVLEHIPNYKLAIKNSINLAKKYIVITVPSKPDDNPEHIHLLTKEILTNTFNEFGITNLKFGGVNNHLFLVVKL